MAAPTIPKGKGKSHGTGPFDVAGTPMTDKVGKSICGDGQGARSDGNVWVDRCQRCRGGAAPRESNRRRIGGMRRPQYHFARGCTQGTPLQCLSFAKDWYVLAVTAKPGPEGRFLVVLVGSSADTLASSARKMGILSPELYRQHSHGSGRPFWDK